MLILLKELSIRELYFCCRHFFRLRLSVLLNSHFCEWQCGTKGSREAVPPKLRGLWSTASACKFDRLSRFCNPNLMFDSVVGVLGYHHAGQKVQLVPYQSGIWISTIKIEPCEAVKDACPPFSRTLRQL